MPDNTGYTPLGKVGMRPRGEWITGESYERLDVVEHNNSSYLALKDTAMEPSDDGINWMLLVEGAPIATLETAGRVKPDGVTIAVEDDGTIYGVDFTGATSSSDGAAGMVPAPSKIDAIMGCTTLLPSGGWGQLKVFKPDSDTIGHPGLAPQPASDKINYFLRGDGTWAIPIYGGICETASDDAEKIINISGAELKTGMCIHVVFSNTDSANYTKLNLNGTGAKDIKYNGNLIIFPCFISSTVYTFVYTGDSWSVNHINPTGGDRHIYVSDTGNDDNTGLESKYAIETIDKLQQMLSSAVEQTDNMRIIYVHFSGTCFNGTYSSLSLDARNKKIHIIRYGTSAAVICASIDIYNASRVYIQNITLANLIVCETQTVVVRNVILNCNIVPSDYNSDGYFSEYFAFMYIECLILEVLTLTKESSFGIDGTSVVSNVNYCFMQNIELNDSCAIYVNYSNAKINGISGTLKTGEAVLDASNSIISYRNITATTGYDDLIYGTNSGYTTVF